MLNPYIVGWIASDGHVSSQGRYWVVIQNIDDSDILYYLKEKYEFDKIDVRERAVGSYGNKPNVVLKNKSVNDVLQLAEWGVPRGKKSHTIKFPADKVDADIWLYLRGYFDGDGCISCDGKTSKVPRIEIASNRHWCDDCKFFLAKFGIGSFISNEKRHPGLSNIVIKRVNHVHRFMDFLYRTDSDLMLKRKYERWLSIRDRNPVIKERIYLSDCQIEDIRALLAENVPVRNIAEKYSCGCNAVFKIQRFLKGHRSDINTKRCQEVKTMLRSGMSRQNILDTKRYGWKIVRKAWKQLSENNEIQE